MNSWFGLVGLPPCVPSGNCVSNNQKDKSNVTQLVDKSIATFNIDATVSIKKLVEHSFSGDVHKGKRNVN